MVNGELLLLDGATGTELNRRGVDILAANTFRTHRRALAGKGHAARELTKWLARWPPWKIVIAPT